MVTPIVHLQSMKIRVIITAHWRGMITFTTLLALENLLPCSSVTESYIVKFLRGRSREGSSWFSWWGRRWSRRSRDCLT